MPLKIKKVVAIIENFVLCVWGHPKDKVLGLDESYPTTP